jgi:hypothetical protein
MKKISKHIAVFFLTLLVGVSGSAFAQDRVGTTAANFLEIGVGGAATAMGDAYVGFANDITSMYWNPAGLAYMDGHEAMFILQPWLIDISSSFAAVGIVLPGIGTIGMGINTMDYGEEDVTNEYFQEGTGERWTASDLAFNLSYGRQLAPWFSFGATGKFISSKIWHTSASALAVDMGVIVNTKFFSPTGEQTDGMRIGMSISNFGTQLKYDGMDLLRNLDINELEAGHFETAQGKFELRSWELPLIFRIGFAVMPVKIGSHSVTLAVDALHPNNNGESLNLGGQYAMHIPGTGTFFLRGGYKGLLLDYSEYGPTFGAGMVLTLTPRYGIKFDYSFRDIGILGNVNMYSLAIMF